MDREEKMTEEYLYDPDPRRRRRTRRARTRRARTYRRYRRYDPDPRRRSRRRRYDPGRGYSGLFGNLLVLAGAGLDSYLTTKHASTFGKGMNVPTIAKTTTTMPYTEVIGIAGGLIQPLFLKGKTWGYIGKLLTGMGANGVAKILDPREIKEEKKEKSEVERLMEVE
jgi:hypothetical protein